MDSRISGNVNTDLTRVSDNCPGYCPHPPLSPALRQLIHRNTTTAQDQNEYRKSYDAIAQKFSSADEQKKLVDKKLSDLLKHRYIIENFIRKLKEQSGQISEFSENHWCGLLDYVTAYADGRLLFRFKNGSAFEG